MRKSTFFLLWLFVSVLASAQNPPGRTESEPTVEVVTPDHVYATSTESLRHLDFHNLQFRIFDEHGKSMLAARLRNGKYESKWTPGNGSNWLRLDWVRFVDEESQFAIASLSWVTTGGSASDFGVVQVFTLREGHPVVVQQILFNTRGCGASSALTTHPLLLTIKGVHGWEHCCPNTLDVIKFNWAGGSFQRRSHHSVSLPETC
jgi:hypothetical protein